MTRRALAGALVFLALCAVNCGMVGRACPPAVATIRSYVPACYTHNLGSVPIRATSARTLYIWTGDKECIGLYRDTPSIWVASDLSPVELHHTCIHEWGHYVWCRLMTRVEHARFYILWENMRAANALPSDYAASSVTEGFAEVFADQYETRHRPRAAFFSALEARLTNVQQNQHN